MKINNFTNINKTDNYLSPQIIEHTQKKTQHMHGIGNPCFGLGQAQNVAGLN